MAHSSLRFPPKSAENRKAANVCEYCRNKGWSAELAANKLRDGIVHLTIDQLEETQRNGHDLTPEDMVRLWNALIDAACQEECGCAQVLQQHVHCDELQQFWAATRSEPLEGARMSRRQKKNQKKNEAKKSEIKEAPPPAPLGTHHAEHRRYKKKKARAKQAAATNSTANPTQASLPGPAPVTGLSNRAFGGLQQALPIRLRAAPPANPVQTVLGHPVTFVATLPTHTKTVPK